MGLQVTKTGIEVLDSGGGTIVDGVGLTSPTSFVTAGTTALDFMTNNTSYIDVPDAFLSFSLSRGSTRVLMIYSMLGWSAEATAGGVCCVCLSIDGVDETGPLLFTSGIPWGTLGQVQSTTCGAATVQIFAAGAHTIKLRAQSIPSGNISIAQPTLNYAVWGK